VGYTIAEPRDAEVAFGAFRKMRRALGVESFGINQIELPPGASGREHDESDTGPEEVYVVLDGSGTMTIDGADVPLHPGVWVRVDPGTTRLPTAGPDGLVFIAVGGPPGGGFSPRQGL
jgi:quercetin dioxygenase-like cupin family protein